ncbi:unnamed protein product [Oppiella nova]|uniref:RFX1-4/6/8-like BCD domain-containing protein n=1 Tax=Oppiella nova TaxID=334625 RepID=A0A7R9LT98_9ACAR|nr:unnamed protein product [Oppiella nova]CAG2166767.1 unnamed protein product [Oppiella nova]
MVNVIECADSVLYSALIEIVIPFEIQRDKLSTFLIMYRSHCQRILDTFVVANTDEVNKYLSHFWTGIPHHLMDLLENEFMVNVIECADSVLYSAIEDALSPKSLYELPEQFTQELIRILNLMPKWIEQSMVVLSTHIMNKKLEVLQQFSAAIRRQLSFLQLVKSCKIVIQQQENVSLMCREIKCIETQEIWSQIVTLLSDNSVLTESIHKSFCDLIHSISQDINFEYLTDWVNTIVDKYVVNGKYACLTSRASQLVFALGTYLSGISQITPSLPPIAVDNCQQQYNDINQWMSLHCHQWDQYSDDYLQNYSSTSATYAWNDSQYVDCMNDQFMVNTNHTITSNGNVYTCLS